MRGVTAYTYNLPIPVTETSLILRAGEVDPVGKERSD